MSPGGFDRRIVICLDLCEVRELPDVGDEGAREERRELLDQLRRKRLTFGRRGLATPGDVRAVARRR